MMILTERDESARNERQLGAKSHIVTGPSVTDVDAAISRLDNAGFTCVELADDADDASSLAIGGGRDDRVVCLCGVTTTGTWRTTCSAGGRRRSEGFFFFFFIESRGRRER